MADGEITKGNEIVKKDELKPQNVLVFPVSEHVCFPEMTVPFIVTSKEHKDIVQFVEESGNLIGVFTYKSGDEPEFSPSNINETGVLVKILKKIMLPDGNLNILMTGLSRIRIEKFVKEKPYLIAKVEYPNEFIGDELKTKALFKKCKEILAEILKYIPSIPKEFSIAIINIDDPKTFTDFVAQHFDIPKDLKEKLIGTYNITDRLEEILVYLTGELEIRKLGEKIQREIREKAEKRQKEYFLREQLKAIKKELGEEVDEKDLSIQNYQKLIEESGMPEEVRKKAEEELKRLEILTPESQEYNVIKTYLDWLCNLPWNKRTEDNMDINHAEEVLDRDHYGLKKVKERIIEFLAIKKLNPEQKGAILCFAGPPGVGKTSIGKSIAEALGRKFVRFSLGGLRDEAEIRGHRRTYVAAMPGKIIQHLKRIGTKNPVIMLDEIDKLGHDFRGDPSSAMLEVLDPEQNKEFVDNYLDVPFDLSEVFFIATANIIQNIPAPLLDRMDVIEFPPYIEQEKFHIAKRYLIAKQIKKNGLKENQITFTDGAITKIINEYTREAGVRNLERQIGKVCRKVATLIAKGKITHQEISEENLSSFLGAPKYINDLETFNLKPGMAIGLAWTPVGGDILFIESALYPGKGGLELTGQLGEVMNESARISLSFVKSKAEEFEIDTEKFEKCNIHVHFPAGAIPKDGPSAGITITTALISLLKSQKGDKSVIVPNDLAMTGEITLTGRVLPIGGLREKVTAARRYGIKRIIFPKLNEKDLEEIPDEVKEGLTFFPVKDYSEVFDIVFKK